jgi:hypothetical protein
MMGWNESFAVFLPVPAGHVEFFRADMRGNHGLIAAFDLFFFQKILQTLTQGRAFWQPQAQAPGRLYRKT